mgnify:CR=1 FL=1
MPLTFFPVEKLGWDTRSGDSDLDKLLRVLAISAASHFGDKTVIDEALKRFESGSFDSDLRGTIYKIAVKHGDIQQYEKMLEVYKDADMHAEKLQAFTALGATTNEELKKRTLSFALSDQVRSQDLVYGPSSTTGTLDGTRITWEFLKEHWSEFCEKLAASGYLLARCIQYSASGFLSEDKAAEVEEFFAANPTPQADRAIQQTLESIRSKASWFTRDGETVQSFFESS